MKEEESLRPQSRHSQNTRNQKSKESALSQGSRKQSQGKVKMEQPQPKQKTQVNAKSIDTRSKRGEIAKESIKEKGKKPVQKKRSQSEDEEMKEDSDQISSDHSGSSSDNESSSSSSSSNEEEKKESRLSQKSKARQSHGHSQQVITKQLNESKGSKVKKSLRYVDRIKKEVDIDSKHKIKFQGYTEKDSSNQMCHACFQSQEFPITKDEQYDSQDYSELTQEQEDAKLLYEIVYCLECSIAVHYACLGEKHQLYEISRGNHEYLIFKCEKCELKQSGLHTDFNCFVCKKDEGYLKPVKIKQKGDKEEDELIFVHQICAVSNNTVFQCKDPFTMTFEMDTEQKEFLSQQCLNKGHKIECELCHSSSGKMKECNISGCNQYAHAYCVMNLMKEYCYGTKAEEDDIENKHPQRWMFQIIYSSENEEDVNMNFICNTHMISETTYCYCEQTPQQTQLFMCDYCYIWYHATCFDGDIPQNFKCPKCTKWLEKIQEPILNILLNRKSIESYLNEDKTEWSFEYLLFNEKETQFVESRIFEQTIFTKLWHVLAEFMISHVVHQNLIQNHLKLERLLILSSQDLQDKLKQKQLEGKAKIEQAVNKFKEQNQLQLLDEIDSQLKMIPENVQKNKLIAAKHLETYKSLLSETKLLNDDMLQFKHTQIKHKLLQDAQAYLTHTKNKPTETQVSETLDQMRQYDMEEYLTYQLLQEVYNDYEQWEQESLAKFQGEMLSENAIQQQLDSFKRNKGGKVLQNTKYKYLKSLIDRKSTVEEGLKLLSNGKNLKVNISDHIQALKGFISRQEHDEKEFYKLEKANKTPVKHVLNQLVVALAYPLKTKNIENILEKWYQSALWHSSAKGFVKDKKLRSQDSQMDIDEGDGSDLKEKECWTIEEGQQLMREAHSKKIYYDQILYNNLEEKVRVVSLLKESLKTALSDKNDTKGMKDYIKLLKHHENIDFKIEIEKCEQKLKIIEMTLMLQAKLRVAQSIQNEFREILKANQDSFSKTMLPDMKKIVAKAIKEQNLEMKEEQDIINNIPQSEEWFLQTYEKLKKLAGKSLNQVDFKEFTQLSTVIQDQRELDSLLKTKMPSDQLVGAAQNLWKSLSGVKWLSELRKVIKTSEDSEIDLEKIKDLHYKARAVGIEYDKEAQKKNIFERHFEQFGKAVSAIESYETRFGTKKKVVKTLESLYDQSQKEGVQVFDKFLEDLDNLQLSLNEFKIISINGDLEILEKKKLHTWISFMRDFYETQHPTYQNSTIIDTSTKQATTQNTPSNIVNLNKTRLTEKQIMLLSTKAEEIHLPDELSIRKFLSERKNRFEKFTREYDDYKRFREAVAIKATKNQSQGLVADNNRYTYRFIKRLIEECKDLQIQKDDAYDYDVTLLQNDLKQFLQWKEEAEKFIKIMEEDENNFLDSDFKEKFSIQKQQMRKLPIYDKDLYSKFQCVDWLYLCQGLLDQNNQSQSPNPILKETISYWENLIKQVDKQLNYFPDIQSHSIYQRTLWEVQQAQEVIEFVVDQKNNIKNLGSKFNLDKQQNYAFFRNKLPKSKVAKMLEQAKRSQIDLQDEERSLTQWISDYDKYTALDNENKLAEEMTFDQLKDILRIMYISPIDYGEIFLSLKSRIDTVEMIKLNLKRILSEHEEAQQVVIQNEGKPKRLRYGRVSYDLKLFKKSGNISGIKEIELVKDKVEKSIQKLDQIKDILNSIDLTNLKEDFIQKNQKLEKAKLLLVQVEIDMEEKEKEIHRLIFEASLQFILYSLENHKRKLNYEDFNDLDKTYDKLRNHVKNDAVISKYLGLRNKALDNARRINKAESKEQIDQIRKEVEVDCPLIDFTQLITDKGAKILLGKRKSEDQNSQSSSASDNEQSLDRVLNKKRQKTQNKGNGKTLSQSHSNKSASDLDKDSGSESDSSSSSSSGSSSGSNSSSGSGSSESSSGSDSGSESEEVKGNIAQGRSRRKIVPNLNSDFIYENPLMKKAKKKQSSRMNSQSESESESSEEEESKNENSKASMNSEEKRLQKKERKNRRKLKEKMKEKQRMIERKKKEKMRQQLAEYRLAQNKTQQTIQQRTKLAQRLDEDQPITISTQIAGDKDLQGYLLKMKLKIREETRAKFNNAFKEVQPVFSQVEETQRKSIINEIEKQIHTKHPEVDSYYKLKANDTVTNIKYLQDFKEIQTLIASSSESIPLYRLFHPHHSFKDFVEEKMKVIKKRRLEEKLKRQEQIRKQREQENFRKQLQQQQQQQQQYEESKLEVQVPQNQEIMKVLYSNQTSTQQQQRVFQDSNEELLRSRVKVQEYENVDDDDEFESSLDSNPALFSDEEEIPNPQQQQQMQQRYDPFAQQNQRNAYNQSQMQYQQQQQIYGGQRPGQQNMQQINMQRQQVMPYNPYECLEIKYGRFNPHRAVEPILYDPIKAKNQPITQQNNEKNIAPIGSLLKVWEGIFEVSKDLQPLVQFYSTYDIQMFQLLPNFSNNLPLKGKSKLIEVTEHFLKLKKEKKLLRGWVTRKGQVGTFDQNNQSNIPSSGNWQENSDKYTKLFDELDQTNKSAIFNIIQGVTLYIVPITSKTKDFCKQMGIYPQPVPPTQIAHGSQYTANQLDLDLSIHEETHCYAFLCHIKQAITNRSSFLNPDVLRVADVVHSQDHDQQNKASATAVGDACYSPISSEDECGDKRSKHKNQILKSIKQEDHLQFNNQQVIPNAPQQVMIKTDLGAFNTSLDPSLGVRGMKDEEGDSYDIDKLINEFKTKQYDFQSIQDKLMQIIHKVKGEDEDKLTQFLEDLIKKYNNPIQDQPMQESLPQIKQEQPGIMYPQNQSNFNPVHNQMNMQQPKQFGIQQQNNPMFNQPHQIQSQFQQFNPMMNQQFGSMPVGGQIRPPPQVQGNLMMPPINMNMQGMSGSVGGPQSFQMMQGGTIFPNQNMMQPGGVPMLRPPPNNQMTGMGVNPMMGMPHIGQSGQMPNQFGGVDPTAAMINPLTGQPYNQQHIGGQQYPYQQQPRR